jgi:hypothetical protein
MATATSDEKLAYVMAVLAHTDTPKPDWTVIANAAGINTASNAYVLRYPKAL